MRDSETPVWVEVKQRINRVTQKRRALLSSQDALALCSGREPAAFDASDSAVLDEVLMMVGELTLRPSTDPPVLNCYATS